MRDQDRRNASPTPAADTSRAPRPRAALTQLKALTRGRPYPVQRAMMAPSGGALAPGGALSQSFSVHEAAASGVQGGGSTLPHLQAIQASFGRHDVSGVQAHVGGAASQACESLGATAYATGNHVAFGSGPDLHTAAHEAAHVVQQRGGVSLKGGIGQTGDRYERHADAVADRVVQGRSAEGLLDQMAAGGGASGVQALQLHADVEYEPRSRMRLQNFAVGDSELLGSHRAELASTLLPDLQAWASELGGHPLDALTLVSEVVGFASPDGELEANDALGYWRASSAYDALFEGMGAADAEVPPTPTSVGEDHEGRDADEADYGLWRAVEIRLQGRTPEAEEGGRGRSPRRRSGGGPTEGELIPVEGPVELVPGDPDVLAPMAGLAEGLVDYTEDRATDQLVDQLTYPLYEELEGAFRVSVSSSGWSVNASVAPLAQARLQPRVATTIALVKLAEYVISRPEADQAAEEIGILALHANTDTLIELARSLVESGEVVASASGPESFEFYPSRTYSVNFSVATLILLAQRLDADFTQAARDDGIERGWQNFVTWGFGLLGQQPERLDPHLDPVSLAMAGLTLEQVHTLLRDFGAAAAIAREVAYDDAMRPLFEHYGRDSELRGQEREPVWADFELVPTATWARFILDHAPGLLAAQEQLVADAQQAWRDYLRAQHYEARPLAIEDYAGFILGHAGETTQAGPFELRCGEQMELNLGFGQRAYTLVRGGAFPALQDNETAEIFQIPDDVLGEAFVLGAYTRAGQAAHWLTEIPGEVLVLVADLYPPLRWAITAAEVMQAATFWLNHGAEIRSACGQIVEGFDLLEPVIPALSFGSIIWTAVRQSGESISWEGDVSPYLFVRLALRTFTGLRRGLSGAASGVRLVVDCAKQILGQTVTILARIIAQRAEVVSDELATADGTEGFDALVAELADIGLEGAADIARTVLALRGDAAGTFDEAAAGAEMVMRGFDRLAAVMAQY